MPRALFVFRVPQRKTNAAYNTSRVIVWLTRANRYGTENIETSFQSGDPVECRSMEPSASSAPPEVDYYALDCPASKFGTILRLM